jgi:hypothetical protein
MSEQDLELLGAYWPGFFQLFVNTTENIFDLNGLYLDPNSRKLFSTFLHEYIHFLQEITSTSTVWAAGRWIDQIKEVNADIRSRPEAEFKVPFNYSNDFNIRATNQLFEIYRGDDKQEEYAKYDYCDPKVANVKDKDGNILQPIIYWIYYHTFRGEKNGFSLDIVV